MIEIRTFDGDVAELARFCTSSWQKRYAGRMPVPVWLPDFLEWELLGEDHAARQFLVAAYDGSRLVGAILGPGGQLASQVKTLADKKEESPPAEAPPAEASV